MSLAAQEMNKDNFCTSSVCVEVVKVVGSGGGKGVSVLVCIPTSGGTAQCTVRGGRKMYYSMHYNKMMKISKLIMSKQQSFWLFLQH